MGNLLFPLTPLPNVLDEQKKNMFLELPKASIS